MTDEKPTYPTVEEGYRAWLATLGPLSPRQVASASQLLALARQLDLPGDRPAAALASLSRAIGKVADALRDEKNQGVPVAAPQDAKEPVDVVDEIAKRRADRLAGGGGAA